MDVDMEDTPDLLDPIDSLNDLESTYYNHGYTAGFTHGTLHGLFEGRALGKEKAWEIWEELGFMLGVGEFWREVGERQAKGEIGGKGKKVSARAMNHITTLLSLISAFPTTNPSDPSDPTPNSSSSTPAPQDPTPTDEPDLLTLLSHIRARYRLLCSSLSLRPRLVAAEDPIVAGDAEGVEGVDGGNMGKPGAEGPMKGVDQRLLRF